MQCVRIVLCFWFTSWLYIVQFAQNIAININLDHYSNNLYVYVGVRINMRPLALQKHIQTCGEWLEGLNNYLRTIKMWPWKCIQDLAEVLAQYFDFEMFRNINIHGRIYENDLDFLFVFFNFSGGPYCDQDHNVAKCYAFNFLFLFINTLILYILYWQKELRTICGPCCCYYSWQNISGCLLKCKMIMTDCFFPILQLEITSKLFVVESIKLINKCI